jgi:hypothetical protein
VGGGAHDVFGEVVDPLLDLELVLVEVEGEIRHRGLLCSEAHGRRAVVVDLTVPASYWSVT